MKSALITAVRSATDVLFPPECVHCGTDGDLFCDRCVDESTQLKSAECCRTCALPSATSVCEACFIEPPILNRVIAAFTYESAIRDAIAAFKYRDIRSLRQRLGQLMSRALPAPAARDIDVLIPVPVTRKRLRSRGYNQSELLAQEISLATGIDVRSDVLDRLDDGKPQAKSLNVDERKLNVQDAFNVTGHLGDKRVLLIDDVMTTGSTLNACASVLKSAGAKWTGALVLAREL